MNIVKFLMEDLPNESSKNAKIEMLKQHGDNEKLMSIFKFVYNPMIVSGISKAKLSKILNDSVYELANENLVTIYEVMDYLKENSTGSDLVIANIHKFLNLYSDERECELCKKIITKDLQTGITAASLNKAYGKDFIRKFDVQKAESYYNLKKKLQGEFFITEKLDGIRALAFKFSDDNIVFYGRSGKEIEGLSEITAALSAMPSGYVYDGELLAFNNLKLSSKDLFAVTTSIANRKGIKIGLEFNIFDMLPIKEFNEGVSREKAYIRNQLLTTFIKSANSIFLSFPEFLYIGDDESVIEDLLLESTKQKKEGLMISMCDSLYMTKRTKGLLKVKQFKTVDLLCKRVEVHKKGDRLGAIVVDYKGYEVNVGSGFTDYERLFFWGNKEEIIGNIVEVQFFEETTNKKDDSLSLRFPVFKIIRKDKTEASYH